MPVKINKEGRYEIAGSERGTRFHRLLPKGAKRAQAVALERKIRSDIFNAKELGHVPDYTIGEAIMRYRKEYTGKAWPKSHVLALESYGLKRLCETIECARKIRESCVNPDNREADKRRRREAITNSTINRRLAILRRVCALAYRRWGWLKEPLHEKIEMLPENPARTVYLSRSELAALVLRVKSKEHRRAILMAAFTGMRRSELLGLKPDDIRGNTVCLTDTKTSSPRNVPIIPSIAWAFKRPLKLDPTGLSKSVHKASGGKVRFHDLRHTTASLLANAGVPEHIIGAILGHKSRQTTKRYSHLNTKTLETAMVLALKGKRAA